MSIELTEELKILLSETAAQLRGPSLSQFMARTVLGLGYRGQSLAHRELGWMGTTFRNFQLDR